ncbi:MAG: transposase [Halobacteriales archaeon]|nr:transposase [Halobacteriales archaeon]
MDLPFLPPPWQALVAGMASFLHQRHAWRLAVLLLGALFAKGRRTVTSWLRAARVGTGFAAYYYFLAALGRHADLLAGTLLQRALLGLAPGGPLLFALDDSPTKRYGPKVQGAGIHHNPAPGPADQKFLYGHVWVTLAWVALHPLWGAIGLPLLARLYVRKKDVPRVPARQRWAFRTKLELAAELVGWAAGLVRFAGRAVRVVADGAYARRPFLRAAAAARAAVVSRLRKDAALRTVPRRLRRRRRGRPPTYGPGRISLAKRAGQKRGWQVVGVRQYGAAREKRVKTFEATWRPAGGRIRVVIVREDRGWLALFSTDCAMTAEDILAAAADRFSIEQDFHDLKEVEGLGQQQVRDIQANVGAFHVSAWVHTLVELWAWRLPAGAISDRRDSPWDDAERRPSHADRRKALQRQCLGQEFQRLAEGQDLTEEIQQFIGRLINQAA